MPLIMPSKRAVALKLKNPSVVTQIIPEARVMDWRGQPITLVPYRLDETRVLRNLGHDIPSPVRHYYEWSGQYQPFNVQVETVDLKTMSPRMFNNNAMGSGKSICTLWGYDYLRSKGKLHKALIVAPLSTLERAWGDEIFRNFPHLTYAVLHGSREKRLKLLADPTYDLYVINHDGMEIIQDALADRPDIDLVVLDELAVLRNAQTARWKSANVICNVQQKGQRWVWGLTGTPTPNAPTDAYAQIKLVRPEQVRGISFTKFKAMVMYQVSTFVWLPKPEAQDYIAGLMQPSIRFSLDDCVDLPEIVTVEREAPLSKEQARAYNEMLQQLVTEMDHGEIVAVNEAVKANKLLQIVSGVGYDVNGGERVIGAESRIAVVKELIEESASGKAIVFCPFRAVVDYVAEQLTQAGYRTAVIKSEVTKTQRDKIFADFQNHNALDVIVAIPSCMSHGLTLTAASTIVWYAPIASNDIFEQANGRVRRPGQKHKCVMALISGSAVERRYYQRLKNKQASQGVLLDLLRGK